MFVPDPYDDGGFSGGTLERPALKRLLADIEAGRVDVVVVYKIDRLSRALMDFARLVEVFDRHGVTFVSVTQSFNTTTSMGRLTLNILLSFAQFEREVIGERIRDKIAASRRRGKPFDKGMVYKLVNNRVYVGEAVHKGTGYPGEHEAIIDRDSFDRVQAILASNGRARAAATRSSTPALLKGLIFTEAGRAMTPTHTKKGSRLYRYYVSTDAIRGRDAEETVAPLRLPADVVETAVVREIRRLVRMPEIVAQAVAAARRDMPSIDEREAVAALGRFGGLWAALFPTEQARIVRLLVARVTVTAQGLAVDLRTDGLGAVLCEMLAPKPEEATA